MSTRRPRTRPCSRCRDRHVTCVWDDLVCRRCRHDGSTCSGPLKKTKPPCASCVRVSVQCVWDESSTVCKRCSSKGGDICPLPPRKLHKRRYDVSVEAEDESRSLSMTRGARILDIALTTEARNIMAMQGRLRLAAVGLVNVFGPIEDEPSGKLQQLYELSSVIYTVSGLKFCNYVQRSGQVQPIESVSQKQWLEKPAAKATPQENALMKLFQTSWSLLRSLAGATDFSTNDVLATVACFRLALKLELRLAVADDATFRQLLAWAVLLCVLQIQMSTTSIEQKKLLAEGALQLAASEAYLSLALGTQSLIKMAVFEVICPRPKHINDIAITLADLEPLLDLDDGLRSIDVDQYLRTKILPDVIQNIHWLRQRTVLVPPYELVKHSDGFRNDIDALFTWLDSLTYAVASTTRRVGNIVISQRALRTLRSVFCAELCIMEMDVLLCMAIQRQSDTKDSVLGDIRVVGVLRRIVRGLRLIMPSTNLLSDLFHVLDLVCAVFSSLGESLAQYLTLLPLEDRTSLMESLQLAGYWSCQSWKMLGHVGQNSIAS